jgi:hypothetical protein
MKAQKKTAFNKRAYAKNPMTPEQLEAAREFVRWWGDGGAACQITNIGMKQFAMDLAKAAGSQDGATAVHRLWVGESMADEAFVDIEDEVRRLAERVAKQIKKERKAADAVLKARDAAYRKGKARRQSSAPRGLNMDISTVAPPTKRKR